MIEFKRDYEFTNDHGTFEAHAKTYEGHTGYGNDTSLAIEFESDTWQHVEPLLYDIRYAGIWTAEEVDEFVRQELASKFKAVFE